MTGCSVSGFNVFDLESCHSDNDLSIEMKDLLTVNIYYGYISVGKAVLSVDEENGIIYQLKAEGSIGFGNSLKQDINETLTLEELLSGKSLPFKTVYDPEVAPVLEITPIEMSETGGSARLALKRSVGRKISTTELKIAQINGVYRAIIDGSVVSQVSVYVDSSTINFTDPNFIRDVFVDSYKIK